MHINRLQRAIEIKRSKKWDTEISDTTQREKIWIGPEVGKRPDSEKIWQGVCSEVNFLLKR